MKPLTHEELDAIEAEIQKSIDDKEIAIVVIPSLVMRLIAAARRSIPRPIAEAPSNCESIVRVETCFLCDGIATNIDSWYIAYKDGTAWYTRSGNEIYPTEFIPIPEPTDGHS